jgi:cytochrome c553
MNRFLVALSMLALLAAVPAKAESLQELVETCEACHGKKGVSEVEGMPSLAGQPDIFTQYQLVFIRDGQRKVEAMEDIAKKLTDDNIRDLLLCPVAATAGVQGRRPGRCGQGQYDHATAPLQQLPQGGFFGPGRGGAAGRPAAGLSGQGPA